MAPMAAPLTRLRANNDHIHGELAETYYAQSSSVSAWITHDIGGHFSWLLKQVDMQLLHLLPALGPWTTGRWH